MTKGTCRPMSLCCIRDLWLQRAIYRVEGLHDNSRSTTIVDGARQCSINAVVTMSFLMRSGSSTGKV